MGDQATVPDGRADAEEVRSYPVLTICTPAYNRGHLLERVADSLRAQTLKNFEWIVVDDGSTDRTREVLNALLPGLPFPARCVRLPQNGGMHIALNRGLAEARGEFFLQLDSDDWLMPNAIERYMHHWDELKRQGLDREFFGVWALCVDEAGSVWGTRFPEDAWKADMWSLIFRHRNAGDKKGVVRTAVWRRHPYAEEPFLTSNPWLRMPRSTRMLFVNEPLYVYTLPSAVDSITRGVGIKKPQTLRYRNREMLNLTWDLFFTYPGKFVFYSQGYAAACDALGIGQLRRFADLNPGGAAVYAVCRLALRVRSVIRMLRGKP